MMTSTGGSSTCRRISTDARPTRYPTAIPPIAVIANPVRALAST